MPVGVSNFIPQVIGIAPIAIDEGIPVFHCFLGFNCFPIYTIQ